MKRFGIGLALVVVMAIGGCAPKKPLTPEEAKAERQRQLNMITRVYEGKTPEEVLLAADRVFRLADEDYEVMHADNSLQAHRRWVIFALIVAAAGTDTWRIDVAPLENGTKVVVRHSGQGSSVYAAPMPTSGGGTSASVMTSPALDNITTTSGIYNLFYARMDYLLGKRKDWMTCKQATNIFKDGNLDPFCTLANDRTPDGKSASERTEIEEKVQMR